VRLVAARNSIIDAMMRSILLLVFIAQLLVLNLLMRVWRLLLDDKAAIFAIVGVLIKASTSIVIQASDWELLTYKAVALIASL